MDSRGAHLRGQGRQTAVRYVCPHARGSDGGNGGGQGARRRTRGRATPNSRNVTLYGRTVTRTVAGDVTAEEAVGHGELGRERGGLRPWTYL